MMSNTYYTEPRSGYIPLQPHATYGTPVTYRIDEVTTRGKRPKYDRDYKDTDWSNKSLEHDYQWDRDTAHRSGFGSGQGGEYGYGSGYGTGYGTGYGSDFGRGSYTDRDYGKWDRKYQGRGFNELDYGRSNRDFGLNYLNLDSSRSQWSHPEYLHFGQQGWGSDWSNRSNFGRGFSDRGFYSYPSGGQQFSSGMPPLYGQHLPYSGLSHGTEFRYRPGMESGELQHYESLVPRIDVYEDDKFLFIDVEVPGFSKDKIHVNVMGPEHGKAILIQGDSDLETEKMKNMHILHQELGLRGKLRRLIRLPEYAKIDAVDAAYKFGVLTIKIPKLESALLDTSKLKKIDILDRKVETTQPTLVTTSVTQTTKK